jgi:hypothetical protein
LEASVVCPDLTIKTSTWNKKVRAGKNVKVTVRVVNKNKKNETESLSVSLQLPAGVTYRTSTVLPKHHKLPADITAENGIVTWTAGPLARRKSRKFVATLQVNANLPSGTVLSFAATVNNGAVCFVNAAPRDVRIETPEVFVFSFFFLLRSTQPLVLFANVPFPPSFPSLLSAHHTQLTTIAAKTF